MKRWWWCGWGMAVVPCCVFPSLFPQRRVPSDAASRGPAAGRIFTAHGFFNGNGGAGSEGTATGAGAGAGASREENRAGAESSVPPTPTPTQGKGALRKGAVEVEEGARRWCRCGATAASVHPSAKTPKCASRNCPSTARTSPSTSHCRISPLALPIPQKAAPFKSKRLHLERRYRLCLRCWLPFI